MIIIIYFQVSPGKKNTANWSLGPIPWDVIIIIVIFFAVKDDFKDDFWSIQAPN